MQPGVTYNARHQLADVVTPDGTLLGAVPHTPQGIKAGEDALTAYALLDVDTPQTLTDRLRCARRVVSIAGGTPNTSAIRRELEPWEVTVRRHQLALRRALEGRPFGEGAARAVGQ